MVKTFNYSMHIVGCTYNLVTFATELSHNVVADVSILKN